MEKKYTVVVDGKTGDRALGGERTLAEILTEGEYELVKSGELCAFIPREDGVCLVPLDGKMTPGETVELLPTESDEAKRRLKMLFGQLRGA